MAMELKSAMKSSSAYYLFEAFTKENSTEDFLESVFKFLHQKTDFYVKYDFHTASTLITALLKKYANEEKQKTVRIINSKQSCNESKADAGNKSFVKCSSSSVNSAKSGKVTVNDLVVNKQIGDNYNGASCENYSWSQTHDEIDVMVYIPESVTLSNHVRVFIRSTDLTVVVNEGGNWVYKINGRLCHPIRTSNSVWTLHGGSHIHLSLEKDRERWWTQLIVDEQQVEVGKVDRSVQMDDLTEEARAMVKKLAYNQYLNSKVRSTQY